MATTQAIAIPGRKRRGGEDKEALHSHSHSHSHSSRTTHNSVDDSVASTTLGSSDCSSIHNPKRFDYGSYGSVGSSSSTPSSSPNSEGKMRRESLMSATFSRAEHTVINVGEEEECLRLITCVKASQGFDWNQEIFLPSYADYHFDDLERRPDPVQDIILTEEEVRNMFPS
ncbi:hypothetical protein EJ02DRAFT_456817 [Clathrospora elynae]|uniref:Uncharacterized protein n=1 Tax=Clathrospora elynae TaxID=706981 RepID=A0A6A5SIX5_9PLEO|nr:hypothetical protein EJ02DRAFT_456817 [Clathrospora elynae]